MLGDNDLGDSAHTNSISASSNKESTFSSRFKCGTANENICTFMNVSSNPKGITSLENLGSEFNVIAITQRQKSRTKSLIIRALEGVQTSKARHINVIIENHDVSNLEALVQATSSVSGNEVRNSEDCEDSDRENSVFDIVALVRVQSANHANNWDLVVTNVANNELTCMTLDGGLLKTRDLTVGDFDLTFRQKDGRDST